MQHFRKYKIDMIHYEIWSSTYDFNKTAIISNCRDIYKSYNLQSISKKVINLWVNLESGTL